jgi:hypothetical protein
MKVARHCLHKSQNTPVRTNHNKSVENNVIHSGKRNTSHPVPKVGSQTEELFKVEATGRKRRVALLELAVQLSDGLVAQLEASLLQSEVHFLLIQLARTIAIVHMVGAVHTGDELMQSNILVAGFVGGRENNHNNNNTHTHTHTHTPEGNESERQGQRQRETETETETEKGTQAKLHTS